MNDYRVEQARKRLVVSAGLIVAAYSFQWAGILELSASATAAVLAMTLSMYDLTGAEATLIQFSETASANWMLLLAKSLAAFALAFAAFLFAVWRFLPRRAASGLAAIGMFAAFLLALPFAPGSVLLETVTGRPLAHFMDGDPVASTGQQAIAPIGGGVPWLDLRAFAGELERQDPASLADGEAEVEAFLAALQRAKLREGVWRTLMGGLIGVAFWSTFAGLIAVSVMRPKVRAAVA